MRLSDDELKAVLARAEEIHRNSPSPEAVRAELEAVVGAGEAVGLSRSAVERAFLERVSPADPPEPGALVFAWSTDGKFYVAEVLETGPDSAFVAFLRGGEHHLALSEVRPLSLLPGEKVVVDWPWWGPWTSNVVSYDAARGWVTVNDGWGGTHSFRIEEVWLEPPRPLGNGLARMRASMLAIGGAAGAIIGSLLTAFILR